MKIEKMEREADKKNKLKQDEIKHKDILSIIEDTKK
jgi:hypothetical protein